MTHMLSFLLFAGPSTAKRSLFSIHLLRVYGRSWRREASSAAFTKGVTEMADHSESGTIAERG